MIIKVGITGGIGSGKSTVCRVFEQLGIPVFYADKEAKCLMDTNEQLKQRLEHALGTALYLPKGGLDRKKLADIIFSNQEALATVNSIVHPAVKDAFLNWAQQHKGAKYVIEEAAILHESTSFMFMDFVVTVAAPEELRIARVMKRDGVSRQQVLDRMKNQWTEEEKIAQSDYVIYCDDQRLVLPQILKLHGMLCKSDR